MHYQYLVIDQLFRSLCLMIDYSRQFRLESSIQGFKKDSYTSELRWVKEYCTVRFALPRQSGNSTIAQRLYESDPKNSVVVVPTTTMAEIFAGRCDRGTVSIGFSNLCVIDNHTRDRFVGKDISMVIVDAASCLSQNQLDNVFKGFARHSTNDNFVLVLIG